MSPDLIGLSGKQPELGPVKKVKRIYRNLEGLRSEFGMGGLYIMLKQKLCPVGREKVKLTKIHRKINT